MQYGQIKPTGMYLGKGKKIDAEMRLKLDILKVKALSELTEPTESVQCPRARTQRGLATFAGVDSLDSIETSAVAKSDRLTNQSCVLHVKSGAIPHTAQIWFSLIQIGARPAYLQTKRGI